MKMCPVRSCGQRCEDRQFVCGYHWRAIPGAVRLDVGALFNKYRAEELTLGEFQRLAAELIERRYPLKAHDEPTVTFGTCGRCGAETLLAHREDGTGNVTLEVVENGPLVVVGGTALSVAGRGRQFVRFAEHFCGVATVATRGGK